jgi:hypothetical protein
MIQRIYNSLRTIPLVATCVNYFISRERAFRKDSLEAVNLALMKIPRAEDGALIVHAGLFKGMRWPRETIVGSEFSPKVLGTYELEIQEFFRQVLADPSVTSFVDVGAAEGYYAVGAAYLTPRLPVFAFEIQETAHAGIRELAESNNVRDRVTVLGEFRPGDFDSKRLGGSPLVLVDIDGGEEHLIDDAFIRLFRHAIMIIEIHDFVSRGLGSRIKERLERSHSIVAVPYRPRTRMAVHDRLGLPSHVWRFAVDEKRPLRGNYWIVARPKP